MSDPSPGEVYVSSSPKNLSMPEAAAHCVSNGSLLATVGQLHVAWRSGLQSCEAGLLSDGTLRYAVSQPRPGCGEGRAPGVYTNATAAGQTNATVPFHVYCFRGQYSSKLLSSSFLMVLMMVLAAKL